MRSATKRNVKFMIPGGRKILETILSGGDFNTIAMPSYLQGIYVVKVTDGIKIVSSKIAFL